ncbi:MAG TPA: Tim44/TimA family putative adaptor protein [Rhizomicrobium sp.]|jgi:predicted lipid-binding transport protein (Tim44 family)|nr:Tim44/TimA family putative adaptor protein [Rhizomicrobium sp.]
MPDSQTLGLFIAATVAGIICFRLYWILGRRTGNEPQLKTLPASPAAPQPAEQAVPASSGLLDIQLADRDFDTPKFLAGAREAYGRIVTAFANGDREALRPLLSAEVMAAFDAAIAARTGPAAAFVRLHDARIAGAALHGRQAEITVAFVAEFSGGNVTDVWTFSRDLDSGDPNWTLVATSGEEPGGEEPRGAGAPA